MRKDTFPKFARKSAKVIGSPISFVVTILLILIWGVWGFFVNFSDFWQLSANTITTLLNTVMLVLNQNTQNRDSLAMQLKLNEIIRSSAKARNTVIALEEKADNVAEELQEEFKQLRDEGNLPD
jgi:low affinity Fe/Cu permease